jgi:putative heme-binding domain-containing protein
MVAILLILAVGGQPQSQARQYPQADIEAGAALYASQCATCHGPGGNSVGGVDLASNKFRRAVSDQDLMNLVTTGIPDSGMPSRSFSQDELVRLVAYLRNMRNPSGGSGTRANASRGGEIFAGKGGCLGCHRLKGSGSHAGPDLSSIATRRPSNLIRQALIDPRSALIPINRPVRAVTKEGRVVNGRRLNEDTFTVQIGDEEGRLVSLAKAELREYTIQTTARMPSYQGKLTAEELDDLVSYLLTLKGS